MTELQFYPKCTDIVETLQSSFLWFHSQMEMVISRDMAFETSNSCWGTACCRSVPGVLCLPGKALACSTAQIFNAHVQAAPFLPSFNYFEIDLSPQTGSCFFNVTP